VISVPPRRRRIAIVLMTVGVAVAVPCAVIAELGAKDALRIRASVDTPSQFQVTLPSGQWEIYEQTGTTSGGSIGFFHYSYTSGEPPDISAGNVRVEDSAGTVLPLEARYGGNSVETYSTGSRIYTGVVVFDATRADRYSVVVDSPAPGSVIVARPPLAALAKSWPLIVAAVLGGVSFVFGLILLIIDMDRRRRSSYAALAYGPSGRGTPPAWPPGYQYPRQWVPPPGVTPWVPPSGEGQPPPDRTPE